MKVKELFKTNYKLVLLVLVAFSTMALVSYFYVSSIMRQQMQIIGDGSMDTTQALISASLKEAALVFANIEQSTENMLSDGKTNEEILTSLHKIQASYHKEDSPLPDFMKIYGYLRGEWLDASGWEPPSDYVPETRPWHVGAKNNGGQIFFLEPYRDAETGDMCISFSQELLDKHGAAYGVLAMDLQLTRITSQVNKRQSEERCKYCGEVHGANGDFEHLYGPQIAESNYGVLVDDKLRFIVHRDPSLIGKALAEAGGDYPLLAGMLERVGPLSAVRFKAADGTDSVVFFRKIFNGWYIGSVIPRSSYYSKVHSLGIVLGVLGLFLAAALSYLLVRYRVEKMRSQEESLSKSSFLARMSHEMRTPMNAIIGMADIARKSDEAEKKEHCLVRISDASKHLLGVINDVLDMSKIEAGKLELSETDFSLESMLRQVETVVNYKIEEKEQNFRIEVADDVPKSLIADKQRLAQVITNLLSNANKFTPEKGNIVLRIRRLPDKEGMCVLEFEVEDSGIGVPPEVQSRLFQSFEQSDGSISRKYGGTGLGLAISKKIVEMMHGRIWIESEVGKGSRFLFTILTHEGAAADEGSDCVLLKEQGDMERKFTGKRLLLAEDVEVNREILISLLENTGIQIDSAENGRIACSMFEAAPDSYDMIFMDIHMPEMDGYEATKCIRNLNVPKAKNIPIVAMTASVFREDIERCRASGMQDHVGKPLDVNDVLSKMDKYLNENQAQPSCICRS